MLFLVGVIPVHDGILGHNSFIVNSLSADLI